MNVTVRGTGVDRAEVQGGGAGTISYAEVSCPSPIKEAGADAFAKSPTPPPWLRPYNEVPPKTNVCSAAPPREGGGAARNSRHGGKPQRGLHKIPPKPEMTAGILPRSAERV